MFNLEKLNVIEEHIKDLKLEISKDVKKYQETIAHLQYRLDNMSTTFVKRGKDEMRMMVLQLLKNDELFTQIDTYIPDFIEKRIYYQIIDQLVQRVNTI